MATGMTTQLKDMARSAPGAARGARPLATWKRRPHRDADRRLADHRAATSTGATTTTRPARSRSSRSRTSCSTRACRSSPSSSASRWPSTSARPAPAPLRGIVDLKADPGRLRRRLHRPVHPRRRRPVGPHLALASTASRSTSRRSSARRTCAVLRRPARVVDRHPLDVGQARPRARLPRLPAGAHLGDRCSPAMLGFITMYTSAWMTNVPPTTAFNDDVKNNFHDVLTNQHDRPDRGPARLRRQPLPLPLLHGRLGPSERSSSRRSCCSARRC